MDFDVRTVLVLLLYCFYFDLLLAYIGSVVLWVNKLAGLICFVIADSFDDNIAYRFY